MGIVEAILIEGDAALLHWISGIMLVKGKPPYRPYSMLKPWRVEGGHCTCFISSMDGNHKCAQNLRLLDLAILCRVKIAWLTE